MSGLPTITAVELPPIASRKITNRADNAAIERNVGFGRDRERIDRHAAELQDRVRADAHQRTGVGGVARHVGHQQRRQALRKLGEFDGGVGIGAGGDDIGRAA